MKMQYKAIQGECLNVMKKMGDQTIDMIYLDPPFFTNKVHKLISADRSKQFSFDDIWDNHKSYFDFMLARLSEAKRLLKATGTIFIHCDRNANHLLRIIADEVFGENQFISEIIWNYRRWSNSSKSLIPNHQNILFYSKTDNYKFNTIYTDYSETTNVDQILQKRVRDIHGKAVYARDVDGAVVTSDEKKGVPLSDVWDIPFLNPKAKERTGYPTQKPILLLERIIEISTDAGDVILDPFCGSGTTLIAAKLLGRNAIGIDNSKEAIELTQNRLKEPIKTESNLINTGRTSYINADMNSIALLQGLDIVPVHRNLGIDAILKSNYKSKPVPIRVQKQGESLSDAADKLLKASTKKGARLAILLKTSQHCDLLDINIKSDILKIIESPSLLVESIITR